MAVPTAGDVVALARDYANSWDKAKVPDGWVTETGYIPPGPTMLKYLKARLRALNGTGYNQCISSMDTVADQETYLFTRQAGRIRRAYLVDTAGKEYPLQKTTIESLDTAFWGWKRARAERPYHYYFIGTKAFGIYPIVNNDRYTIKFHADAPVAEPAESSDVIAPIYDSAGDIVLDDDGSTASVLPQVFFDTLSYGIAADLCRHISDWAKAGYYEKQFALGIKELEGMVNDRQTPDMDTFELSITSTYEYGPLGVKL